MLLTRRGRTAGAAATARRQRRISLFVLTVLAVTALAGFTDHDLYPFSAWNLAARRPGPNHTAMRLMGVDAAGVEYVIDARAWEPISGDELRTWLQLVFPRLPPEARARAAAYLFGKANAARARVAAGRAAGVHERWFGRFAATETLLHRRLWTATTVPPRPFVALRIYRDKWNLTRRERDPTAVEVRLQYEYRAPSP